LSSFKLPSFSLFLSGEVVEEGSNPSEAGSNALQLPILVINQVVDVEHGLPKILFDVNVVDRSVLQDEVEIRKRPY